MAQTGKMISKKNNANKIKIMKIKVMNQMKLKKQMYYE